MMCQYIVVLATEQVSDCISINATVDNFTRVFRLSDPCQVGEQPDVAGTQATGLVNTFSAGSDAVACENDFLMDTVGVHQVPLALLARGRLPGGGG